MAEHEHRWAAGGGGHARLRRFLHLLRTKHSGPERDPIAVAVGVFIGCTPLYGLHLILSLLAADAFKLNRLKVYLAANISNPFLLPFLVFSEVQIGALLLRGSFHPLTRQAISSTNPWVFGLDLVVGSVALGIVLAIGLGALTYAAFRNQGADPQFSALVDRAAGRYAASSFTAWEFANAKLRTDPVYRMTMRDGLLPGGGTLLDLGCGQGLMLALLVEARADEEAPEMPAGRRWPRYEHLVGIDTRPRVAYLAAEALSGPGVDILTADVRSVSLPPCAAVLLFDVLHMMPHDAQDALLATVRTVLRPDGVVLVREADAGAGWRFTIIRIGNRMKALVQRRWGQPFSFRHPDDWEACFRRHGFRVDVFPGPTTNVFGNTLFRLTLEPASPNERSILRP